MALESIASGFKTASLNREHICLYMSSRWFTGTSIKKREDQTIFVWSDAPAGRSSAAELEEPGGVVSHHSPLRETTMVDKKSTQSAFV